MLSHKSELKIIFVMILLIIISANMLPHSLAQTFDAFTDSQVYSDGKPLFVYGQALPEETIIIRLFAPDGTIAAFDQVTVTEDGSFNHVLLTWPNSSTKFPYGTYTVEVISNTQQGLSKLIDVKFTSTTELIEVPVQRQINTLVFAPETAAINHQFRIFVQITSDGVLVGGEPRELLATSHVHLPNGEVQTLTTRFQTLHPGLYFVDYTATLEGTYVFHVVTFTQGSTSHGSAATNILKQDISGISEQILNLNSILADTSNELDVLESRIETFDTTLESASTNIASSVTTMSSSVENIEIASTQLNSLLFPIVGAIGVIVALQIVILARRR